MSTYEELCELYARANTRANERRRRAATVFAQAGDRIVRRLGVPEGAYGWRPAEFDSDDEAPPELLDDPHAASATVAAPAVSTNAARVS